MKRIIAMLLSLLLMLSMAGAEAPDDSNAVPAMDMSLEEAAKLGLTETADVPAVSVEPFAPDTLDKAIIGSDDRITVTETNMYPYSAIAYLEVRGSCGCTWAASGFMVSRDCLMTGAHCVLCGDHNQPAEKFVMYFGYKSHKNYLLKYDGDTSFWWGANALEDGSFNSDWDFAFIKLTKDVGSTTGWFGLTARGDAQLEGARLEVAGYRDGLLKKHWGTATVESAYCINYDNDTQGGNSGCPVFTDDYYVVAIHVAGVTSSLTGEARYNVGRRITDELLNDMIAKGMFN